MASRLPPALRPLRHRDFAIFWAASLVSNIGSWMEMVAIGALVAHDTRSARTVALTAAAAFVPMALFAPLGGVIGDRIDRKRLFLATVAFDTTLACVLAAMIAAGVRDPRLVSVILFLEGASVALSLPTRQAITPDLVPQEELLGAVSLGSASWNAGRVFGPVFAGVVVAATSTAWALVANAASFVVLFVAALFVRIPTRPPGGRPDHGGLIGGMRAVLGRRDARLAVLAVGLFGASAGPFIGLIPIVAEKVFGNARHNAVMISAQGIGAVVGTLVGPSVAARIGRRPTLAGSFAAMPVLLLAYARAPTLLWACAALLLIGGLYFVVLTNTQTLIQLAMPDDLRARGAALGSIALSVGYAPTVVLAGWLADRTSLRLVSTLQAIAVASAFAFITARFGRWWHEPRPIGRPSV